MNQIVEKYECLAILKIASKTLPGPDPDSDDVQNLSSSSISTDKSLVKFSRISNRSFFTYKLLADRQTDKREVKYNLVGGSNNSNIIYTVLKKTPTHIIATS